MKRAFFNGILSAALIGALASAHGQSNVYSLAIYSAGNSYATLCSLTFPFAPYDYKLTERSWYEDAMGRTIIDVGHEQQRGGVLRQLLEVQCSSNSFGIRLDSGVKHSGDLASLVTHCASTRGGHVTTNPPAVMRANWICKSWEAQDLIVVDGDRFSEVKALLEQAYGVADATIRSSALVGNGRSLTYTPQQIGVLLNLTADSRRTIVSVLGKRKL